MNKLFRIISLLAVIASSVTVFDKLLFQVQPVAESSSSPMLKPGDRIDDMLITTGAGTAPPLWAFCSSTQASDSLTTVDCHVPLLPKLTIGRVFGAADQVLQPLDWSALRWKMYLDEQLIDLNDFGTYNFILPDLAPHPSPIREVIRKTTVWDVVLVNPAPGNHTLRGLVNTENGTYEWIVNFTVDASVDSQG